MQKSKLPILVFCQKLHKKTGIIHCQDIVPIQGYPQPTVLESWALLRYHDRPSVCQSVSTLFSHCDLLDSYGESSCFPAVESNERFLCLINNKKLPVALHFIKDLLQLFYGRPIEWSQDTIPNNTLSATSVSVNSVWDKHSAKLFSYCIVIYVHSRWQPHS